MLTITFFCGIILKSLNFERLANADMAELADAYGSGPYESNFMQVQVLLSAPYRVFITCMKL